VIVACVCWGDKYSDNYVKRLKVSVQRKLKMPHRFVCLSDREIAGVECIPLFAQTWTTWWQKITLFSPDVFPAGSRIFYLDLDVVVVGEIDSLVQTALKKPLTMIYNFGPNRAHCAHNSSVMMWTAGDPRVAAIFNLFTDDVMTKLHGDQCWIWRVLRDDIANWQIDTVKSYKYDCRKTQLPANCRIVVFHGDPKPHQAPEPWAHEHWG